MSTFVYSIILAGNLVFFMLVLVPDMKLTYQQMNGVSTQQAFVQYEEFKWKMEWNWTGTQIEYLCYQFSVLMLIFSHAATMCRDPGIIPKGYQYDEEKLAKPYRQLHDELSLQKHRQSQEDQVTMTQSWKPNTKNNIRHGKSRSVQESSQNRNYDDIELQMRDKNGDFRDDQTQNAIKEELSTSKDNMAKVSTEPESELKQREMRAHTAKARPMDFIPVEIRSQIKDKMVKKCNRCQCVKPPKSHHCSTCGHCILGMDHHCPWMNNCIGLKNQKAFVLFNFYAMTVCAWTAGRVGAKLFNCVDVSFCMDTQQVPALGLLATLILIFCILFFLFTITMFIDQVQMIQENTSTIDKMQARRANLRRKGGVTAKKEIKQKTKPFAKVSPCFWVPLNCCLETSVES